MAHLIIAGVITVGLAISAVRMWSRESRARVRWARLGLSATLLVLVWVAAVPQYQERKSADYLVFPGLVGLVTYLLVRFPRKS